MSDEPTPTKAVDGYPTPESTLNELFSQYAVVRETKSQKDRELDVIDEQLTALREQIIPLMTELEYQSVNYNGVKYWIAVKAHPSIIEETRGELLVALKEEGEYGLVQVEYINPTSAGAWYRNLPENLQERFRQYFSIFESVTLNSPRDYKRKRKKK